MRKSQLLGATALAIITATPAFAQDTSAAPQAAAADDTSADEGETEIIVTASKREQTLQDVPISVAVTSGDTIEKAQIRDLIDLQTVVPSLRVSQLQSSANTNFIIRGFGNGANNVGIEPSVGVFIDGVYRSRSAAQIADLPNLKRVEVLRGPQSTLFGKNASAGIISIVTAEPQFKFGGSAEASYGNYNAVIAKASVTGPISETMAFSLAGNYNRRDGYARDLNLNTDFNDRNRYGVRGQLLFQPSDQLKLRLIGDYDKIDENCCIAVNVLNGPAGAIINKIGGRVDANQPFSYNVYNNFESTNNIKNYGGSLQADYDLDQFRITSISAYRKVDSFTNQDSDFTSADLIGDNRAATKIGTTTQELRFASNLDGPLNFLVGGFYFHEKIKLASNLTFGRDFRNYAGGLIRPDLVLPGFATGSQVVSGLEAQLAPFGVQPGSLFAANQGRFENYRYRNTSYSLFGTADLKLGENLTLTGGLNYTNDRKRVSTGNSSTDAFSRLDLVQIGFAGGLARAGVNPANPAAVAAFAQANPAVFQAIVAGSRNPAVNTLLGLTPFQFLPPFVNFPNAVESGRTKDDKLSYTVRAAYKFSNRVNVYATYATGFKASSFNVSYDSRPFASDLGAINAAGLSVPNLTTGSRFAGPENATNYEAGIKLKVQGLAVNLAVFKQSLKGFQGNTFTGTGFVLTNAGKQSAFGVEFDASVSPVRALNFTYAMTYLKPKYDSYVNSSVGDLTGQTPAGIPKFSLAVGGNYTYEFAGGTKLNFRTDFSHQSKVKIIDGDPATVLVARYTREVNDLNAAISLELENGLEVGVWGRNLTNQQYLTTVFPGVAQNGTVTGYPSQPRTYGVQGRFKF